MNSQKVLFLATSSNASPARGGRRRIVDVAHQASRFGLIPRILCFLPFEQVARGPKFWREGKSSLQNEAGCTVSYWPMLPLTRFGIIEMINIWYCGLVAAVYCRVCHIHYAYGHGLRAAQIALSAKPNRKSLRVIADIHGAGSAEYAYQKQLQPEDRTLQRLEEAEKQILTQADQLIFVSQKMHRYYEDKFGRVIENHAVIPCAINAQFKFDPQKRASLRREHNLLDKLVVAYAGSAVAYQLVDEMCILFKAIHQHLPNAHFMILSHHSGQFQRQLDEHKINTANYSIFSVTHEGVFDLLQMGDVGLMLRDDSILNIVASPTKFAEYLLCGLPVITSDYVGDFSNAVKAYKLGFTVDLSELNQVDEVVSFLLDVQTNRNDYALRCIRYVKEHLHWRVFDKILLQCITGIKINGRPAYKKKENR